MAVLSFSLGQLAEQLGATLQGDAELRISGLAALQQAQPSDLSFLANAQYRKFLASSQAGAVLLTEADAQGYSGNALITANPYLAYARLSHLFDRKPQAVPGIHPSALVAADAQVDPTASIGPGVVIESQARIGAQVVIGAYAVIGTRSSIGDGGWLPRASPCTTTCRLVSG